MAIFIIKDQLTGRFFSLLGSAHFTDNLEIAQRFETERDAILCEEQIIHCDTDFDRFDTLPCELMVNGMQVKFKTPEDGEENFIYTIIDASDQDMVLMQCINSGLSFPPVETINPYELTSIF